MVLNTIACTTGVKTAIKISNLMDFYILWIKIAVSINVLIEYLKINLKMVNETSKYNTRDKNNFRLPMLQKTKNTKQ